jgi:hypothetical protein
LRHATKKRPLQPPTLTKVPSEQEKLKAIVADQLAKLLIRKGLDGMSDYDLRSLVYKVIERTDLDDGSFVLPPPPQRQQQPVAASLLSDVGFGFSGNGGAPSPYIAPIYSGLYFSYSD